MRVRQKCGCYREDARDEDGSPNAIWTLYETCKRHRKDYRMAKRYFDEHVEQSSPIHRWLRKGMAAVSERLLKELYAPVKVKLTFDKEHKHPCGLCLRGRAKNLPEHHRAHDWWFVSKECATHGRAHTLAESSDPELPVMPSPDGQWLSVAHVVMAQWGLLPC